MVECLGQRSLNHLMPGKSFAELLKRHRREAGCSQEALAERSGLSVRAISALEQGSRRGPYSKTVTVLSDALRLSAEQAAELEAAATRARGRSRDESSSFPTPLTSFVDRAEVGEIAGLLRDHRLVTVSGSGGVGKTRVAIEVVRRCAESFDQTWFVDLQPIRDRNMLDGNMVATYIAARITASENSGDAIAAIERQFESKNVLLMLDNCEQVVEDVAIILVTLLSDLPRLTVLATSREALGLVAECVFRLPPMTAATASELFVARARTHDRTLFFDTERLAIVADICSELDCLPLAIELTASRLSTLGFVELRERLKHDPKVIVNRGFPQRQQTIDDTIRWSYDPLQEVERRIFERLSAFMGGFTLAAAENVCADEFVPADAIGDVVQRLVQKSLIDAQHVGLSRRYRFLETIRAFAWERMSARGEGATTMRRLIDHFSREVSAVEQVWTAEAIAPFRFELDNVGTAIIWATQAGDAPTIAAAAQLLIRFRSIWYGTNRQGEMRMLGLTLLERLHEDEEPELVGLLISALGGFLSGEELVALTPRVIPLLVTTGHKALAAGFYARVARHECFCGNAEAAEAHLVAAGALLTPDERTHSRAGFFYALSCADIWSIFHKFDDALAAVEDLVIPPSDPYFIELQFNRAEIRVRQEHFAEALEIVTELKPQLARYSTSNATAVTVFGIAGKCELLLGNAAAAEADIRRALTYVAESHSINLLDYYRDVVRYAAIIAGNAGRLELAARLLGACDGSRERPSVETKRATELIMTALTAGLTPERISALRTRGAAEDFFELVDEFLSD